MSCCPSDDGNVAENSDLTHTDKKRQALILVDIQKDFCPGGALAVFDGDQVVPVANRLAKQFHDAGNLVVATRDMHPANHGSFASQSRHLVGEVGELGGVAQVFWPDHCVYGTSGAEFHPDLHTELVNREFWKGMDAGIDSYSGFYDNNRQNPTGLSVYLKNHGVTDVTIVGLATDYCVAATARDALAEGFKTTIVAEGCRAVNVNPGDGEKALIELARLGVEVS